MKTERKYLEEYGIKRLKKKYDVNDLLDMLPKRWKEGSKKNKDEHWESIANGNVPFGYKIVEK